jgi:uncharacterized protein (TIGR00297 family)
LVLPLLPALAGIILTFVLAAAAAATRSLTPGAAVVAASFGSLIVVLAGFPFLALLVLFVVASVLATRYGFDEKKKEGVQEGTRGERGVSNVLAHIVVPSALVATTALDPNLLSTADLTLLYTAALAFAAADTFASEFGVLSGGARSILTRRPVPPGTNGGVSGIGELWAFVGAVLTAVVGFGLFLLFHTPLPPAPWFLVGATVAGFVACQIDSILGEVLENRGYLTKGGTNLLAMVSSVAIAGLFLWGAGA